MRYLLDTNVISALMKGDVDVVARLKQTSKDSVSVPQPVLAELSYGLKRLPRSKRRRILEDRFQLLQVELLRSQWTDAVSEHFGEIKATLERRGTRIEDFDAAIAAHALAEGAVLVTANLKHLARVPGLTIEDWAARV